MRRTLIALALAAIPATLPAQPGERGLALTVFRSPATGLELRAGRAAAFAGFYPTILRADGQADGESTSFVRAGATWYLRPRGWSPFVSPSIVWSLDRDWRNGALTEAGVRFPLGSRVNGRLGVGVLTTFDGEARVNPTVGLDIPLGRRGR